MKHPLLKYPFFKSIPLFALVLGMAACQPEAPASQDGQAQTQADPAAMKQQINTLLDDWHRLADVADSANYFGMMTPDGVFIGTDKTEVWTVDEFKEFCVPVFADGKGWDFTPTERNIYFSGDYQVAWFNEQLDTWMGVCQSSGVLEQQPGGGWLIAHYQLSVTIPNDIIKPFIALVEEYEAGLGQEGSPATE